MRLGLLPSLRSVFQPGSQPNRQRFSSARPLGVSQTRATFCGLLLYALSSAGCSIFFGNIRPSQEKSSAYHILDLSQINSAWVKLNKPGGNNPFKPSSKLAGMSAHKPPTTTLPATADSSLGEESDMTFQSSLTGSMISMNSACKNYPSMAMAMATAPSYSSNDGSSSTLSPNEETQQLLLTLSRELFLGIQDLEIKHSEFLTLCQAPGLATTARGTIHHEAVQLGVVVLQRLNCTYDFMYIARPVHFEKHRADFEHFVHSIEFN